MEQSFYIRLITVVDDYGRYEAHPSLLSNECFPYGDDMGLAVPRAKIEGMLRSLASRDLLMVYEHEGKQFFQLSRWKERVRTDSKYPDPKKCKVVWKCLSNDWQMSDKCLSDVGNVETEQSIVDKEVTQNVRQMSDKCQTNDGHLRASPPTPTPTPVPTPTPTPSGPLPPKVEASVCAQKAEFQKKNRFEWLSKELCAFYKRPGETVGIGEEEQIVFEVAQRPDVRSELDQLRKYRAEVGQRYFPQSLKRLCYEWQDTLDKSRNHAPAPKTIREMSIAEREITRMAREEGVL